MMARPLDRDILVTSVMPHMHWLGKDFTLAIRNRRGVAGTTHLPR